ncbi:MAG: lytic transglycosylase domain-containing protein, partial [Candidatus Buchananbacteria bacterium]
ISQAKEIMLAAVTGLALVFLSYSILALINPGLLTITMPKLQQICYLGKLELPEAKISLEGNGSAGDLSRSTRSTQQVKEEVKKLCNGNGYIDFQSNYIPPNQAANFTDQQLTLFEQIGNDPRWGNSVINPELLMAIASQESQGNSNAESSMGALGLMQVLPSTVGLSRDQLLGPQSDANNIWAAANYIHEIETSHNEFTFSDILASYNGGASDAPGKAMSPSNDCPGVYSYQCCNEPGGLVETQNYVYSVTSYYNGLK